MPRRPGAAEEIARRRSTLPEANRMPVTAGDKNEAIAIAKTREWWPRCTSPDSPLLIRRKWWFVVTPRRTY